MRVETFRRGRNKPPAFATIREPPFTFPHCCRVGDLSSDTPFSKILHSCCSPPHTMLDQNIRLISGRKSDMSRSQLLRGLRRGSAAARLLRLWVRIPPRPWIFVCSVCCVLSGRGLCDDLITRPEESYRLWSSMCVI